MLAGAASAYISASGITADTNLNSASSTSSGGSISGTKGGPSEEEVQASKPTYAVVDQGSTAKMVMVNVTNSEISNFEYTKTRNDGSTYFVSNHGISKSIDNAECGGIMRVKEFCYILTYNNEWDQPRVVAPVGVGWVFLQEISSRAATDSNATDKTKKIISDAKISYAGSALANWDGVDLKQLSSGEGQIIIRDSNLLKKIGEEKLKSEDAYASYSAGSKTESDHVTVQLKTEYPMAKKDSLWNAAMSTVLYSVIAPYKELGASVSDQELAIRNHLKVYANYANVTGTTSDTTGKVLKLSGPGEIIIGEDGASKTADKFTITLDTNLFKAAEAPTSGYKTNVYLKPTSHSGESDPFILLKPTGTLTEGKMTYSVTWADLLAVTYTKYENGTLKNFDDSALRAQGDMSYQKTFSQKYNLTVLTLQKDETQPPKDRIDTKFSVVNDVMFNDTVAPSAEANIAGGKITLKIKADSNPPYISGSGRAIPYTIEAADLNKPTPTMKKIVLWVCGGTNTEVVASDSSTCQDSNGNELVKKAWATSDLRAENSSWLELSYNEAGKSNIPSPSGSWDISGTPSGIYSLMVKAYSSNAAGSDIPGAKIAATLNVTDAPVIGDANGGSGDASYGGALNFGNALNQDKGSSIKTVEALAERILLKIVPSVLGGLAVIAILFAGIMYISSGGDPKKAERGKKALIYSVLGIVIAASVWAIAYLIMDLIKEIFK